MIEPAETLGLSTEREVRGPSVVQHAVGMSLTIIVTCGVLILLVAVAAGLITLFGWFGVPHEPIPATSSAAGSAA